MISSFVFSSDHYFKLPSGYDVKLSKPDYMPLNESIFFNGFDFQTNVDVVISLLTSNTEQAAPTNQQLLSEIYQYGFLQDTYSDEFVEGKEFTIEHNPPSYGHEPTYQVHHHYAPCLMQMYSGPTLVNTYQSVKPVNRDLVKPVKKRCKRGTSTKYKCIFGGCSESFGRLNNRAAHHKQHLKDFNFDGRCPVCSKELTLNIISLLHHLSFKHFKQWNPNP